jgi:hypothetical protein
MPETRQLLERAATSAPPATFELEDLDTRRRRRRTRDRSFAIGTALVLTLAAVGLAYGSLRSADRSTAGDEEDDPTTDGLGGFPPAERPPLIARNGEYYVHRVHLSTDCQNGEASTCWRGELMATWWWNPADDSGRIDVETANAYDIDRGRFAPGTFPNHNDIDVSSFPADPDELASYLLRRSQPTGTSPAPLVSPPPDGAPEDGRMWRAITDLLADPHTTPTIRAALLEVAADLQGSRVELGATDPAGRPAHVISFTHGASGWVERLYVDPASHEFLASAWFAHANGSPTSVWLVETAGVAASLEDPPTDPSIPNGAEA